MVPRRVAELAAKGHRVRSGLDCATTPLPVVMVRRARDLAPRLEQPDRVVQMITSVRVSNQSSISMKTLRHQENM